VDVAYSAADAGETSRVHPQVPMRLAVFDRTAALLPLSVDQLVDSALVVHPCALLDALVEMFMLLWDQAVPVVPAGVDMADARRRTRTAPPAVGRRGLTQQALSMDCRAVFSADCSDRP
jgi:hypothetical protein